MVCIYCGNPTDVTNSRPQKRLNQVWRRRGCQKCGSIVTTTELVDLGSTIRVAMDTRSSSLIGFSRDRLFTSIYESCRHRGAAVEEAGSLTQTVIAALLAVASESILTRDEIIRETLMVLQRFDKAAATMYEAYHPLSQNVAQ